MNIGFSIFLLVIFGAVSCSERVQWQAADQSTTACTTPDGHPGECFNIRQCKVLLELLKRSRGDPETVKYLRRSLCTYKNKDPIVCCPSNRSENTSDLPKITSSTLSSNSNKSENIPDDSELEVSILDSNEVYELPSPPDCGNTTVPQNGIAAGPSIFGNWPWLAALGYIYTPRDNHTIRWMCGGALITPRHVLTAAHCTSPGKFNLVKVRLGLSDISRYSPEGLDVNIEKVTAHPSFNKSRTKHDIAILRLQNEVLFAANIKPICLPKTSELRRMTFVRSFPVVAGWGSTFAEFPHMSETEQRNLIQLQLPVVNNEECKTAYEKLIDIDSGQLCAGFMRGGKGTCKGDSGGPLMWSKRGTFYAIGILSFGRRNCAQPGYPDVFVRMTSYLDWIEENIKLDKRNTTIVISEMLLDY